MSNWKEIRNNFIDVKYTYIDAWKTLFESEEENVIAKINNDTYEIEYLDEKARTDIYAQEKIKEAINLLKEGVLNA